MSTVIDVYLYQQNFCNRWRQLIYLYHVLFVAIIYHVSFQKKDCLGMIKKFRGNENIQTNRRGKLLVH
jgi:hypothetical protein